MIEVRELRKVFRVQRREPGLAAALRSVFRRQYDEVTAVGGLSFAIAAGERVGFLGPNGAGKTTTLKMLAGLVHPTSGEVRVGGRVPWQRGDDFLRSIMLVMGQKQQLLWDLPPAETFELNRAIYGVDRATFVKHTGELVELLGVGDASRKPTRQLSLGERMKCELVAALVHRPRVLFLDEPTIGLDVTMQVALRGFIRSYNEQHGATLLLTSHYMDDVQALCPRVLVIDRGQLSYDGSLAALARRLRPEKRVTFRFASPVDDAALAAIGRRVESPDASRATVQVPAAAVGEAVARALQTLPVVDLTVEDPPLEEVMAALFEQRSVPEAASG
ncbi:MAG: ATP-binding cassette domain-containing protein [Myxococcales bacterium]|nr:MAG: ATP-binding cassette domain-containing protein [Myxococcales bacterium]